jgi:hypothetical protein
MRSRDFVGNAIAAVTDGQWSHAGLLLFNPDGSAWCYEALFDKGRIVKQEARPRFRSFLRDNKDSQLCIVPVQSETVFIAAALRYAESCVKDVAYGRWQLGAMLLAQRFGLPVPHSTTKQVCSEFLARTLGGGDNDHGAALIMDLRDTRHTTYDEVTPDSSFRRMMTLAAGYGDYTSNPPKTTAPSIIY